MWHACTQHDMARCMQVTPLGQDLWQAPDSGVRWARAGVMLALGVLQLLAARLCTQAHLHSALVQWWTHKHSGQAADAGSASRMGTFIKMRADFINVLFCKVWLHLIAHLQAQPAIHGSPVYWANRIILYPGMLPEWYHEAACSL